MTHCLDVTSADPNVAAYVSSGRGGGGASSSDNVTAKTHNATTLVLSFRTLAEDSAAGDLGLLSLAVAANATVAVKPHCLAQRKPTRSVEFTFVPRVPVAPEETLAPLIEDTAQAIAAARAIPGVAVAAARSSLVLTLIECKPDFYEQLDRSQNIFGFTFGHPKVGQYIATSIMNHVFNLGIAGLHLLSAFIYKKYYSCTFYHATSRVRCPSLTLITLLITLEPTAMAAVVTILYGEGFGLKFVGGVSLALCYAYVVAI